MFIDEAEITVRSGKGGDGMVHFRREKYINRGGPDGGDGGRGGNIVLRANPHMNTLEKFRHQAIYAADDGKRGGGNNQTGHSADALVIEVPPGTIAVTTDTREVIADLTEAGQEVVILKGGRGGRGNTRFATSRNQAPRIAEKGEPGEEKSIHLELRLIADIGIIGMPNAGKSSFLAAVTNAKPKIADYPFTTLTPNLGVALLGDETMVLADIPGLIEGAHEGRGLGIAFLRHIQRTRVLIHVLDGLSADPLADFTQTNSELALFDPDLITKPQIVALNKIDQPQVLEQHKKMIKALEKKGYPVFVISALAQTNLDLLLLKALELVKQTPEPESVETMPVYRAVEDPNAFTIEKEEDGYRVKSKALVRAAEMTYWEYDASIRRFQRLLEHMGIDKALREEGIQEGDTVYIGDYELEWHD